MGKASRNKGASGERELVNLLKAELGEGITRNLSQTRDSGHDILGADPFAIEVKRQETLSIPAWWRQTKKNAHEVGQRPALAYRQNGKPWRVMVELTLEEFATIIRENSK